MKKSIKFLFISLMAVFIGTYSQSDVFAHADHDKDAIIIQMADIMINLEHFPTADEKKKLQSVLDSASSTDQEKIIANAIMLVMQKGGLVMQKGGLVMQRWAGYAKGVLVLQKGGLVMEKGGLVMQKVGWPCEKVGWPCKKVGWSCKR